MEVIFRHTGGIGGDGGALHGHTILPRGLGGFHGDAVLGGVALLQAQVVILRAELHKRQDEFVLDHLPEDTGHLIAVHLHRGSRHLDFFHDIGFRY